MWKAVGMDPIAEQARRAWQPTKPTPPLITIAGDPDRMAAFVRDARIVKL